MVKISDIFLTCFLLIVCSVQAMAQVVYTSQPCASGLWSDPQCWSRSGSCPGNTTVPSVPPYVGLANNCPVTVNLNHPRTINGNMATGSGFTLNMNASLTINGNLTSSNQGATRFNVFAGVLTAQVVEVKNDFDLIIHNGAEAIFNELDLNGNQVTIDVRAGGSLTVLGETKMRGNRSDIIVAGNFETGSIDVAGATNNITTSGGATVYVSDINGGITVAGNATLNITGASEVIVEGNVEVKGGNLNVTETASLTIYSDFLINGGANVNITTRGEVYVCGMRPDPSQISKIDDDAVYAVLDDPVLCNITIMPVSWLYFEGEFIKDKRTAVLEWGTSVETGNSHFEIERSLSGVNSFHKIGEVLGMGWKEQQTHYRFEDLSIPLRGGNVLYRLKQVSFEGKVNYSKVIGIRAESTGNISGVWRAFPNPTKGDQFQIDLLDAKQYAGEELVIRLVNPSSESLIFTGPSVQDVSSKLHAVIQKSPLGLYMLEITWDNKREYIKILKN
ncbi:T9SS C-terminal target domain-containing protein [Cecembia rubra]|uniref:T9SS C-terminal target domain-containing protein n=1 Tax=Cecembia rubra TaxID=1485585 RepID=UPI002714614E|nr:T9SS C-terminal target domain-containing protein [Cecembia rubra]